jgi:hypothetical protein
MQKIWAATQKTSQLRAISSSELTTSVSMHTKFNPCHFCTRYIQAYTNPNLTTWRNDFGQPFPKNSFLNQCWSKPSALYSISYLKHTHSVPPSASQFFIQHRYIPMVYSRLNLSPSDSCVCIKSSWELPSSLSRYLATPLPHHHYISLVTSPPSIITHPLAPMRFYLLIPHTHLILRRSTKTFLVI